jgi:NAD-dependent SIR2 family protein deacetylase
MAPTHPLDAVREAAELLLASERVLIVTGAGMSRESGVPTYRDEGGRCSRLEPFASRGLAPADFAHPEGFRERPEHAWAFYEVLRRTVAGAEPHEGYGVITRWLSRWPRSFLLTTNIDELHLRAGARDDGVRQRYGSMWQLQCLKPCRQEVWTDRRVPLVALDEATLVASDLPACPFCGGGARPRTQMAHDDAFIDDAAASARHEAFLAEGEPEVVVVVGTTLWLSWPEHVHPRPRVISINPDPERHAPYGDDVIGLTARASDALVAIDGAVRLLGS